MRAINSHLMRTHYTLPQTVAQSIYRFTSEQMVLAVALGLYEGC